MFFFSPVFECVCFARSLVAKLTRLSFGLCIMGRGDRVSVCASLSSGAV